jgi:hypothetical protein
MTKPLIQINDEVREMNDDELEIYEKIQAADLARKAEAEAKATAKESAQGKLAALGLTVEDLQALGL